MRWKKYDRLESINPANGFVGSYCVGFVCSESGIDMFTAKELEELKKFDAKIEKEFILSPKEYWYSEGIDRQILRERNGIYSKKRKLSLEKEKKAKEYKKQYYKDHREQLLEYFKKYQQEHKERIAQRKKAWYQANKERILANRKEK